MFIQERRYNNAKNAANMISNLKIAFRKITSASHGNIALEIASATAGMKLATIIV
jgi:hypothetical protein